MLGFKISYISGNSALTYYKNHKISCYRTLCLGVCKVDYGQQDPRFLMNTEGFLSLSLRFPE
jgi:hypothetical protein